MSDNNQKTQLKLAWGSYNSLPDGSTKKTEPGTLYLTKDEHSLYVGLTADAPPQRIQGVVQSFSDFSEWEKFTVQQWQETGVPPFSDEVIYYIADSGTLVRWKWTNDIHTEGQFIAINSVAKEDLEALADTISEHADLLEDHGNKITEIIKIIWGDEDDPDQESISSVVTQLIEQVEENTSNISLHTEKIGSLEEIVEDHTGSISNLNGAVEDNQKAIEDLEDVFVDAKESLDGNIALIQGELNAFKQQNTQDHKDFSGEIATIKGNLEKYAIKDEINNTINEKFKAANCLHFKGSISSADDLEDKIELSTNQIGDTYIVTSGFSYSKDDSQPSVDIHIGDLIILIGEEDTVDSETGQAYIKQSTCDFELVNTGYEETHSPEMTSTFTAETADKDEQIAVYLTSLKGSGAHGDLGSFTLSAQDNINIEESSTSNYTMKLYWETF